MWTRFEQQYISHSNTCVSWDFYHSLFTSSWENITCTECVSRTNHNVIHSVIHNFFLVCCYNSWSFNIFFHAVIHGLSQSVSQISNTLDTWILTWFQPGFTLWFTPTWCETYSIERFFHFPWIWKGVFRVWIGQDRSFVICISRRNHSVFHSFKY